MVGFDNRANFVQTKASTIKGICHIRTYPFINKHKPAEQKFKFCDNTMLLFTAHQIK
jgi:hypothetical protein